MCARGQAETAGHFASDHAASEPVAQELQTTAMELLTLGANERWRKFRHVVNELFSEMMNHRVMEEMVVLQRLYTLIDPETDCYLARQHWLKQLAIAGFNQGIDGHQLAERAHRRLKIAFAWRSDARCS